MLLQAVAPMRVVENASSGKFYRTTSSHQDGKSRIRPLELFPTGILIPKCMDTLVESDIEVHDRCRWADSVRIDGRPSHSRDQYEHELVEKLELLKQLNAEYELLPRNGRGRLSRGSHANKILACSRRIEVLYQGLGLRDEPKPTICGFEPGARVILPSGLIGKFELAVELGQTVYGRVRIACQMVQVPIEILKDAEDARLSVA